MFNAGVRGKRAKDGTGFISSTEQFVQQTYLIPTVTSFSVTDVSYVPLDNTAVDTAGGETIVINGSGFASGATVQVGATTIGSVTFVDQNRLAFTAPALSSGSYTIYVTNSNGGTGILLSGLVYSGLPTFTTTAGTLGTVYETANINTSVVATGDAPITYTLLSGTLPAGANINSNGTITGNAPVDGSSTTYSFTIQASDGQLQDSTRAFTLTINTDVLSFSLANNTVYSLDGGTAMSNVTLSATSSANANSAVTYAANTLPTGVSLSGNTIFGTPTVEETVYTAVTATATQTGRTATRFVSWVVSLADVFFKYTTLAINSETSSNSTFVKDASTNNFAVSIFGDTKPNNFNPYTPGYYSNFLDGTGDYLTVPANAAFGFGTGDFTIETWTYVTQIPTTAYVFDMRFGGGDLTALILNTTGSYTVYVNGETTSVTPATSYLNRWVHWAIVRSSGTVRVYVDGIQSATFTASGSIITSGLALGARTNLVETLSGYISNFRVVKGTAVYTSAFTPSTTPLTAIANTSLLTCQSNRFIDNSTNNFTITVAGNTKINSFDPFVPNSSYSTYGSAYIPSAGSTYINAGGNTALALGSGNFTIECWLYLNSLGSYTTIFDWRTNGNAGSGIPVLTDFDNNGTLTFAIGTNPGFARPVVSSSTMPINRWFHLALVRNGSTMTMYFNGVSVGSGTNSSTLGVETFNIGSPQVANYNAPMYVTDVRIVKGTAVYTTAFTPPAAPLTAVAGTSLLTLQNNQPVNNNIFLDNSTNNSLITRSGNTTQGTFSPYGGNWSNYFDGTGDYLTLNGTPGTTLSGNFTLEAWVYIINFSAGRAIICIGDVFGNPGVMFAIDTAGKLGIYYANSRQYTGSGSLTANTWNHVAFVRNSGVITGYINGVSQGTLSTANTFSGTTSYIGLERYNGGAGGVIMFGYISNLRIVNSTAVYTGTFTPPTTPLTPITNTGLLTCADNRLVDDSINNFTITKNGDVSVQRFSPFNPSSLTPTSYSWNLYTDGSYQITRNATLSSLSTGAFTVEGWHYPTRSLSSRNVRIFSLGRDSVAAAGNTSWDLYISNGSALVWQRIQTTATTYSANYTFNINTWYHIVACRDSSSNLALFVNGTRILLQANVTTNYDYIAGSSGNHYIGATYNNVVFDYGWGYYSNIRVIKDATAYDPTQSTLTVPTSPLSVTAQTSVLLFGNNGSDLSGNYPLSSISRYDSQSKMDTFNPFGFTSALTNGYTANTVGGSAYFDGTGDYLTVPANAAFTMGTGDFTIEYWFNSPTIPTTGFQTHISQYVGGTTGLGYWTIELDFAANSNSFLIYYNGSTSFTATNASIKAGQWYHIALVRSGTTVTFYVNGVASGNTTYAGQFGTSSALLYIGLQQSGLSGAFNGYISDVRVVKGTALYTNTFVPPVAPLTAVQNTVLLNNFTNAGIIDNTMINNLETVGDAKISTAVSKFGGSSMSFDGTGDWLTISEYRNFDFGTGDFTVEGWIYMNSLPVNDYKQIVCFGTGPSAQRWILFIDTRTSQSAPYLRFLSINSSGTVIIDVSGAGSSGWSANTWYHVAVTRSGNTFKLFKDGIQNGATVTNSGACPATASTGLLYVGAEVGGGYANWNGYIDDLRITKGYARYTSNFTAPTTSFKTK